MAQTQPLIMPTASELTKAREFLCEAAILVSDVKSRLADSGNCAMAARLKDIQDRLHDEIWAVERLKAVTLYGRQQRLRLMFGLCRRRAHFWFGGVICLYGMDSCVAQLFKVFIELGVIVPPVRVAPP